MLCNTRASEGLLDGVTEFTFRSMYSSHFLTVPGPCWTNDRVAFPPEPRCGHHIVHTT
jgi:hypothetical protein